MKTTIIGFGYKARQGKDTAASAIVKECGALTDIRIYHLADALKVEVFDAIFTARLAPVAPFLTTKELKAISKGKASAAIHGTGLRFSTDLSDGAKISLINDHKDELRKLLQLWGTEVRRAVDSWYWISLVQAKIDADHPTFALVPDIRFKNELGWIRGQRGYAIKVTRQNAPSETFVASHQSESELDGVDFDFTIDGLDGDVTNTERKAVSLFTEIAFTNKQCQLR